MRRSILICSLAALCVFVNAQETPKADPKDVNSLNNIIAALYDVISGPKGEKRDWDRMRSLFAPEARLIPTGKNEDGKIGFRMWTVEDYISTAGASLERDGFFETETNRVVDDYGTITQVFSTYDSRRTLEDEKPFARGINSIQLMKDDTRWWIVNILWMGETTAYPIPKKYSGN